MPIPHSFYGYLLPVLLGAAIFFGGNHWLLLPITQEIKEMQIIKANLGEVTQHPTRRHNKANLNLLAIPNFKVTTWQQNVSDEITQDLQSVNLLMSSASFVINNTPEAGITLSVQLHVIGTYSELIVFLKKIAARRLLTWVNKIKLQKLANRLLDIQLRIAFFPYRMSKVPSPLRSTLTLPENINPFCEMAAHSADQTLLQFSKVTDWQLLGILIGDERPQALITLANQHPVIIGLKDKIGKERAAVIAIQRNYVELLDDNHQFYRLRLYGV